jgi:hypothetical protein
LATCGSGESYVKLFNKIDKWIVQFHDLYFALFAFGGLKPEQLGKQVQQTIQLENIMGRGEEFGFRV